MKPVGKMWPEKEQDKGGVALGRMVWPPTLTIEGPKKEVGPQNSRKTENVAPLLRRKVTGCPSTVRETLGSCEVMTCVGGGVPRPLQSSMAIPRRSGVGLRAGSAPFRDRDSPQPSDQAGGTLGRADWGPGIWTFSNPMSFFTTFKTGPRGLPLWIDRC